MPLIRLCYKKNYFKQAKRGRKTRGYSMLAYMYRPAVVQDSARGTGQPPL